MASRKIRKLIHELDATRGRLNRVGRVRVDQALNPRGLHSPPSLQAYSTDQAAGNLAVGRAQQMPVRRTPHIGSLETDNKWWPGTRQPESTRVLRSTYLHRKPPVRLVATRVILLCTKYHKRPTAMFTMCSISTLGPGP
jgi:hypothetical protein